MLLTKYVLKFDRELIWWDLKLITKLNRSNWLHYFKVSFIQLKSCHELKIIHLYASDADRIRLDLNLNTDPLDSSWFWRKQGRLFASYSCANEKARVSICTITMKSRREIYKMKSLLHENEMRITLRLSCTDSEAEAEAAAEAKESIGEAVWFNNYEIWSQTDVFWAKAARIAGSEWSVHCPIDLRRSDDD